jgi:hypothetical protein
MYPLHDFEYSNITLPLEAHISSAIQYCSSRLVKVKVNANVDSIEIPRTTHHCWHPPPAFNLQYIKLGKMTTTVPLQHRAASQTFYLLHEFMSLHVRDKQFPKCMLKTHTTQGIGNHLQGIKPQSQPIPHPCAP